jgi:hypothetical protein
VDGARPEAEDWVYGHVDAAARMRSRCSATRYTSSKRRSARPRSRTGGPGPA